MPRRKKILILEHDDFLREILGNLLHKENFFILNAFTIEHGIQETDGQKIDGVILGSSCPDFHGRSNIHYLRKHLGDARIFLIHNHDRAVRYLPKQDQMRIAKLSIKEIINRMTE